ncbi:SRPBCC family protein [Streptomyces brevispora]|uniref:SRPBCC family protein n=1 Tax=Streptomyces brevispora TaxID=887462 RepID=UPI0035DC592F
MRTLTNEEGGVIVERLESFDESARSYVYSIVQAPFPVTGYRSTLKVIDQGAEGSRVPWSGTFTPDGVSDAEATALFEVSTATGSPHWRRRSASDRHKQQPRVRGAGSGGPAPRTRVRSRVPCDVECEEGCGSMGPCTRSPP